jgi:hypothetical protein
MLEIVEGSLLDADTDFICHQCNCVTTHGKGLSKAVFDAFPEANIYEERSRENGVHDAPGHVIVKDNVINMLAQYYPGRARYRNDTKQDRINWFSQCLQAMSEEYGSDYSYGFPYKIGCGLAGGDWTTYYEMIEEFAKDKNVKIYRLV